MQQFAFIKDYHFLKLKRNTERGLIYTSLHKRTSAKVLIHVIKKPSKDQKACNNILKSIETIKNFYHTNLLNFLELYENKKNWIIVVEYLKGNNLPEWLKNKKKTNQNINLPKIFAQLLLLLEYFDSKKYYECKITPLNIIVDKNSQIKVDLSCLFPDLLSNYYLNLQKNDYLHFTKLTPRKDNKNYVFVLGLLLRYLFLNDELYPQKKKSHMNKDKITSNDDLETLTIPSNFRHPSRFLMRKMLRPEPENRPSLKWIKYSKWVIDSLQQIPKVKNLYRFPMNTLFKKIDLQVLFQMSCLKYDLELVVNDILNNPHGNICAAYKLLALQNWQWSSNKKKQHIKKSPKSKSESGQIQVKKLSTQPLDLSYKSMKEMKNIIKKTINSQKNQKIQIEKPNSNDSGILLDELSKDRNSTSGTNISPEYITGSSIISKTQSSDCSCLDRNFQKMIKLKQASSSSSEDVFYSFGNNTNEDDQKKVIKSKSNDLSLKKENSRKKKNYKTENKGNGKVLIDKPQLTEEKDLKELKELLKKIVDCRNDVVSTSNSKKRKKKSKRGDIQKNKYTLKQKMNLIRSKLEIASKVGDNTISNRFSPRQIKRLENKNNIFFNKKKENKNIICNNSRDDLITKKHKLKRITTTNNSIHSKNMRAQTLSNIPQMNYLKLKKYKSDDIINYNYSRFCYSTNDVTSIHWSLDESESFGLVSETTGKLAIQELFGSSLFQTNKQKIVDEIETIFQFIGISLKKIKRYHYLCKALLGKEIITFQIKIKNNKKNSLGKITIKNISSKPRLFHELWSNIYNDHKILFHL
ncbi:non-specific serine/threonine protein kinase [Anaeramoeba flamelloides]|uniref:Non-specific serine/threonine protein kinase n=1 Tax=Anaeramoeba flamelloides TaxID=1746091 RepID=A0ABQ8YN96_9EUKA|nr:non-specific serine/threonine protein kinase [Anaeramoeba flamelloides]